jgi:hypothetical protein
MDVFLMGYRYGLAAAKQSVFGSIDTQVPQPVSRSSKTNSAASRASFRSIDDDALESVSLCLIKFILTPKCNKLDILNFRVESRFLPWTEAHPAKGTDKFPHLEFL